jgi:3'-5' exoribonuclease
MPAKALPIIPLAELTDGQEADLFALLAAKQEATTREGKTYWRVTFRDARREVTFPIWGDSPLAEGCREQWRVGEFYKLRAQYRDTSYGPQLDIRRIRPVTPEDRADGFDERMCLPRSRFDTQWLFQEIVGIAEREIAHAALKALTLELFTTNQEVILSLPAARRNHHAFVGGFLEHVWNVARNAVFLADKYGRDYPDLQPPLSRDLVVAGALLHDIGKVQELVLRPAGGEYTAAGELVGHVVLGRDMVRDAALRHPLPAEMLLRLEHIILSHQRLAEWGAPKPPMTPEALLVHFADDVDAKFQTAYAALREPGEGEFTTSRNPLQYKIFRGLAE